MKTYKIIKKISVLLIIMFALSNANAQSWDVNWQSGSDWTIVKFLDANIGFKSSSGSKSFLFKTANGGTDWTKLTTEPQESIQALDFLTPDLGFMCLANTSISKTTNGGLNWSTSSFSGQSFFRDIQIINSQIVYAMTDSRFFKSTNAGASWVIQTIPASNNLYFLNANLGFVLGQTGIVRKTTNGGDTWQDLPTDAPQLLWDIFFMDANNGYMSGNNGLIMRTTNGGNTWSSQTVNPLISFNSINFSSPNNGFAVGRNFDGGQIYTTTNAGQSWQQQFVSFSPIQGISFANSSVFYAFGEGGLLLKTTNQGNEWEMLSGFSKSANTDIHFPTARTGYILQGDGMFFNQPINLNKTTDAGITWTTSKLSAPAQKRLNTIFFTDSLVGYIGGQNGQIYKTTDGGLFWQTLNSSTTKSIEQIHFVSSTTGYAVGGQLGAALLLKTTNAGNTWIPQNLPVTTKQLKRIWFTSPTTWHIVGQSGLVLKTINNGQSYTSIELTDKTLNSVWFKNASLGFAVGDIGRVFKTTNAGQDWIENYIPGFCDLSDLKCIDNTCYSSGSGPVGCIFVSTNMGENFVSAPWPSGLLVTGYNRMYFLPNGKTYLLSANQFFFQYNATGTSVFKPKPSIPALAFDLFPNPSLDGNFTLRHKYQGNSTMIISNIQGKFISKSVLDKSEINIKLMPGFYFIKLENQNGSSVRKLVVN